MTDEEARREAIKNLLISYVLLCKASLIAEKNDLYGDNEKFKNSIKSPVIEISNQIKAIGMAEGVSLVNPDGSFNDSLREFISFKTELATGNPSIFNHESDIAWLISLLPGEWKVIIE